MSVRRRQKITDILKEAAKGFGEGFGKSAYNDLKKVFLERWYENKSKKNFGFPANPEMAKQIYSIGHKTSFKILKSCVGRYHWALNLIKLGIFISELSDKGEREKINEMREQISKNKGWKAINVVNMGSTGAINGIINYLDGLKINDSSEEVVKQEFDRIIEEWQKITVFVEKNDDKKTIKVEIYNKIIKKLPLFFIFSYGADANQIAMFAIAELRNENLIEPKDYLFDSYPHFDGVGTKVYMWSFNLIVN